MGQGGSPFGGQNNAGNQNHLSQQAQGASPELQDQDDGYDDASDYGDDGGDDTYEA